MKHELYPLVIDEIPTSKSLARLLGMSISAVLDEWDNPLRVNAMVSRRSAHALCVRRGFSPKFLLRDEEDGFLKEQWLDGADFFLEPRLTFDGEVSFSDPRH